MKFNVKYLWALLPLLLVGSILYYFSEIVTYVLLAWVISMIGAPVVVFLRKYIGKNLSALITLSLFVLGFILLVWVFIPPLVNQIENLSKINYTQVVSGLEEPIKDWEKWLVKKKLMIATDTILKSSHNQLPEDSLLTHTIHIDTSLADLVGQKKLDIHIHLNNEIIENLPTEKEDDVQEGFFEILRKNLITYLNPENIQKLFGNALTKFGDIFIGVFSVFFISFFFLREQGLFVNIIKSLVPTRYETHTQQAVDETSKLLIRYFVGILVQVTLITLIVSLSLVMLGVPNALLIGFFAGMMNVIPYIGPIIAAGIGMIITLSSNMDLSFYNEMIPLLTKVGVVFLLTRLIDDIILQPNIFSKSVKAHPLEIFIVVLVGAKVGGVLGMVLAIPFYTAFRVIGKVFLSEFKVIQKLTRNM
ncbi:MAG: AI-2E family transporter [Saprospiraceae bacterium]|jgi:predicted PurR-regulated permease PerM